MNIPNRNNLMGINRGSSTGGTAWGDITGTLSAQMDLQSELDSIKMNCLPLKKVAVNQWVGDLYLPVYFNGEAVQTYVTPVDGDFNFVFYGIDDIPEGYESEIEVHVPARAEVSEIVFDYYMQEAGKVSTVDIPSSYPFDEDAKFTFLVFSMKACYRQRSSTYHMRIQIQLHY